MEIGLTYDLRDGTPSRVEASDFYGEFDSQETIACLEAAIAGQGHGVRLIGNAESLVRFLAGGESVDRGAFQTSWKDGGGGQRSCPPPPLPNSHETRPVDMVFNIAEGLWGGSREAQVPAILEAFQIPYVFSDPLTMALCLDKGMTKRLWQHAGLPTPRFAVVTDVSELAHGLDDMPDLPVFVKPLHEGTSKGIDGGAVATSMEALSARVAWVLDTYHQPALVETWLQGREFTVGILGNGSSARALGALEVTVTDSGDGVYGFVQKEECEARVAYAPVDSPALMADLTKLALRAYHVVECKDAGRVDLRFDRHGNLQLLEINPLPGLHPTHSDLPMMAPHAGISYAALIGEILQHAIARWGL